MKPIFIVLARRWGEDETHCYLAGWARTLRSAKTIAQAEHDRRGGKYVGVVYEASPGSRAWASRFGEVWRTKGVSGGGGKG